MMKTWWNLTGRIEDLNLHGKTSTGKTRLDFLFIGSVLTVFIQTQRLLPRYSKSNTGL